MKNYFKNKFAKQKQPVPRQLDEINKTYQYLCAQAGEVRHQLNLKEKQLAELLRALENVNAEATARNKLDNEDTKDATPTKETTAEVVPEVKNG